MKLVEPDSKPSGLIEKSKVIKILNDNYYRTIPPLIEGKVIDLINQLPVIEQEEQKWSWEERND